MSASLTRRSSAAAAGAPRRSGAPARPVRTPGSVTISISGAPDRLKSTRLTRRPPASAWMSFAVSSSRCARRMRTSNGPSDVSTVSDPSAASGIVVLADLVALREVRVEVVLAFPLGARGNGPADRHARGEDVLDRRPIDGRQGPGQAEADRAGVGVRRGAVVGRRAGAEHLRGRSQLAVDLDPDDRLPALEDVGQPVGRLHGRLRRGGHEPAAAHR